MATIDFCLAIGAMLGLAFLFVLPVAVLAMAEAGTEAVRAAGAEAVMAGWLTEMVTAAVLASLCAAVLVWLIRRRTLAGHLPAMPGARAALVAVAGGLAVQAFAIGVGLLGQQVGGEVQPSNALPLAELAQRSPWLAWLLVVAVAPLAEELLFRHVLLRRFALAGRAGLGLAITSLGFAALHEPWPGAAGVTAWLSTVMVYVAMGLGFGLVYVRTGRFWAAVLAHAVCNLAALLAMTYS
ncbi:CPBP family intramembrane glutamic endopeptidase [Arenimonas fontis]|uniref:CPBP family intramembrane metalloprotease n=1 Tax=Arenimonas fontis TaxID=2608255 RepID=A0A5B2Z5A5_9GAMM|nr:CPBP family intramembrane glutamic endopeptidase [Arenimonas fontis]KAA2284038.1 CPBP family intramembrane metalloprotease [Arenimonas fontis]